MILITIFVPVTPGFRTVFPFIFVAFKLFTYFGHIQFMSRYVYKQIVSDKKFGATYLTVLASSQNSIRIIIMNLSYWLIPIIGLKTLVVVFVIVNGLSVFFSREKHIEFLASKTEQDFKVEFDNKEQEKIKKG